MKATGIVRRLDQLGRVVLPIELRRVLGLGTHDGVEIFVADGDQIVLRKYQAACVFCSGCWDVAVFKGQRVCGNCRRDLVGQSAPGAAAALAPCAAPVPAPGAVVASATSPAAASGPAPAPVTAADPVARPA